jgi:hypothetical protein
VLRLPAEGHLQQLLLVKAVLQHVLLLLLLLLVEHVVCASMTC